MAPSLSMNALDTIGLLDRGAPSSITLEGANFLVNGHPVLTEVPLKIVATPSPFTTADKTKNTVVDKIDDNGIGLVPPQLVNHLYEGLHSHLESVGIDGVKVDVIHLLEMLAEDFGGRVKLTKAYYKALTASARKHFKGNGVLPALSIAMTSCTLVLRPFHLDAWAMIFGVMTQRACRMGHFGYKGVTWCIVLKTACGWAMLYTQIGTCSSYSSMCGIPRCIKGHFRWTDLRE